MELKLNREQEASPPSPRQLQWSISFLQRLRLAEKTWCARGAILVNPLSAISMALSLRKHPTCRPRFALYFWFFRIGAQTLENTNLSREDVRGRASICARRAQNQARADRKRANHPVNYERCMLLASPVTLYKENKKIGQTESLVAVQPARTFTGRMSFDKPVIHKDSV